MAFFKFRKGGDDHPTPPPAPESVEAMRKRAKHRLIGAAILVLVGVIGFPLLFDSQPRPISVDIPIEIPDKNKVKPLASAPAVAAASAPKSSGMIEEGPESAPKTSAPAGVPAKPEVKPEPKPEPKPEVKSEAKPVAKVDDGAKAQALLDNKEEAKKPAAGEGRFVVQVGAYSEVLKAREARQKVEKAGLKTYTQVVESKEGKRIRVRVGPFESKAQADKAAEKIKKLNLPAAILEL